MARAPQASLMGRVASWLVLLVSIATLPAIAATVTPSVWKIYVNTRYGVIVDYPADLFTAQPAPPDNAGRTFDAAALKARVFVYSHANALDQTREELEAADVQELAATAVTKTRGADWYQIVGQKNGETVLLRVLLRDDASMLHRLQIAYPAAMTDAFAPIVARMTKSFRVDAKIPQKAAADAGRAPRLGDALTRIDTIALGLRIPGFRGKVGLSADVPADWVRADLPEPNSIEFDQPQPSGSRDFYVIFSAEARRPRASLAGEAKIVKDRVAELADRYRLLGERKATIATRPAVVLEMEYAASDSNAMLFESIAVVDAGSVFYFLHFGSPQARRAEARALFAHILETIAFAE